MNEVVHTSPTIGSNVEEVSSHNDKLFSLSFLIGVSLSAALCMLVSWWLENMVILGPLGVKFQAFMPKFEQGCASQY